MSIIVVLCLALYKLPPTAVAAMMCTERSSLPIEIDASTPTTTDSPVNLFRFNLIDLKNIQEILGSNDIQQKINPLARLSAGFWRRKCKRRRFTHRPKDVTFGRDGAVNAKNVTSDDAARILFGTENECVSTNPGRACVCCMTDFLDLICQRLDEAAVAGDDDENETAALRCRSFKPVPTASVIYPGTAAGGDGTSTATTDAAVVPAHDSADVMVERNGGKRGGRGRGGVRGRGRGGVSDKNAVVAAPMGKEIDFDKVVNYQLEKSSDDHYAVQYALVGSDVKVQCLINGNGTRMNAFKWDFKKGKNTTNSTVTGADTNILLILGLEPGDSKNYTCIPTMDAAGGTRNGTSYNHYVVAVKRAIYEIHGLAVYNTLGGGSCTHEIIVSVQNQLPISMRTELCPEESSEYACNVIVEKPKCTEDKRTMEIKYLVTLNDKANYLARIRTSKEGRVPLRYQKLLARVSKVIASNLNKTLTVQIISKLSLIDTHFEPDYTRMNIKKLVFCAPGFGIREVFCAACPPHHYSPDKSIACLKCAKGFHQPVAGSEKCVKCRNIFSDGCYLEEVSSTVYWFVGLSLLSILSILVISCACCCREENEESKLRYITTSLSAVCIHRHKILLRKRRKKFKKLKSTVCRLPPKRKN